MPCRETNPCSTGAIAGLCREINVTRSDTVSPMPVVQPQHIQVVAVFTSRCPTGQIGTIVKVGTTRMTINDEVRRLADIRRCGQGLLGLLKDSGNQFEISK